MKERLKSFVLNANFPCLMAKAVAKKGNLCSFKYLDFNQEVTRDVLQKIYQFIENFRENPERLSSFIVSFTNEKYQKFDFFEEIFWQLLDRMKEIDKKDYPHDKRVASSPEDPRYSYSLKEEAFFILLLHPKSPRLARRFTYPSVVFNPHRQFENLRRKGKFKKIRDTIRIKDTKLQGFANPMLEDYGESSEIFQYTGKDYNNLKNLKEILKERQLR